MKTQITKPVKKLTLNKENIRLLTIPPTTTAQGVLAGGAMGPTAIDCSITC